ALLDFNPANVRFGSTSAVSGFLRHGCFTPEIGHRSARLARQKSADCVAKRFCASERARLIQDHEPMCNVD
ncbi:MAG: hypothetical protein ABW205_07680, partial [Burkholderiales bacterium]